MIGPAVIAGEYGTLTINPDGSYSYDLDDSEPDVIALDETETLQDVFTYTVSDKDAEHEKSSYSTLTITICGANDGPTAKADTNVVQAGMISYGLSTDEPDAAPGDDTVEEQMIPAAVTGNVLLTLDHDKGDAQFGDVADTDPDGDTLCVVEIASEAGDGLRRPGPGLRRGRR